ncbi:FAD-dependent pyridine nucleotide-disulfide oxidoreductase [Cladochytrium replicatum]|nr:FAD-dependent pyridine nucleotide-disulfide oxidoreductase [Cladochytrium replicatum]
MHVVIVGGVAGGATCAARLRRLSESTTITLFERGRFVSFANCGLPYYIGQVIKDEQSLLLASPELFRDRFNVSVKVFHDVVGVDAKAKMVQVKNLETGVVSSQPYDKLVLSPGSIPIVPFLPGVDLAGIFTLKTIPDSNRIKQHIVQNDVKRAVIVGGGFIGLEMAENLVHLNIHTTVVAAALMPPFDTEMLTGLNSTLMSHGIDLRLDEFVAGFSSSSDHEKGKDKPGLIVKTKAGNAYPADLVILAIGVRPDTKLAKEAGLQLGELGGVKTDDCMRTSDPDIYALGDCVETRDFVTGKRTFVPLAGPANRQARVAADSIMGRDTKYRGMQGTAVCGVFDLTMACTGANERTLQRHGIAYEKVYLHPNQHVGYYPGAKSIKMKILFNPIDGKILGAQAVGTSGVEKRIDVIAMAIQGGLSVYDLEECELCYAPQYGAAKDPINFAGMVASNALRKDTAIVHWDGVLSGAAAAGSTTFLLDVRSPGEFAEKHAPGAMNIPLPELRKRIAEVPKDTKLFVYCGVGQRAHYAVRILRLSGYNEVYNVSGGMGMFPDSVATH